jgi:SAM-dependent methyltransferase
MYDPFAEAYAADNETNAFNALYERPAMLALLGEVRGKRVLDAGCGAGALAQALVERGATVSGFEISPRMAALARRRLDGRAAIEEADLGQPLRYADGAFDLVAASLVLHYLEDWGPPLRELHRVLVPGGRLAISTHHPTMDWPQSGGGYFATRQLTEIWHKGAASATVSFWRRPLTAMVAAFRAADFTLEDLVEPMPLPECAERFPEAYVTLTTAPRFIFFRLHKTLAR